MHTVDNFENEG